jgi:hypothetical protein
MTDVLTAPAQVHELPEQWHAPLFAALARGRGEASDDRCLRRGGKS